MANRIQHRRDTAANWTSINPVLAAGEIGMETDTGNTKLGDGVTTWASLGYQAPNATALAATYALVKAAGVNALTGRVHVSAFGAKGDVQGRNSCAMTAASAILTTSGGNFLSTAAVGQVIAVAGAGTSGAALVSTIASIQSDNQVTLAASAVTTVSAANYMYGTDDSAAISAALTAANAAKAPIQFDSKAYFAANLTAYSSVYWYGAENGGDLFGTSTNKMNGTWLVTTPGTNATLISSLNFSTLTGGSVTTGAPQRFGFRDIVFDGAALNGYNTSGYLMQLYAATYRVEGCIFQYGASGGVWTEWGSGGYEMESYWSQFHFKNNGGTSLHIKGPHDSMFHMGQVSGGGSGTKGVWVDGGGAAGAQFNQVHVWGSFDWGWYVTNGSTYVNCKGEGATVGQFYLGAGDVHLSATELFNGPTAIGLQIGDTSLYPAGCTTDVKITGCQTPIKVVNDAGYNTWKANVHIASAGGTVVSGGFADSSTVLITADNSAAGSHEHNGQFQFPGGLSIVKTGANAFTVYNDAMTPIAIIDTSASPSGAVLTVRPASGTTADTARFYDQFGVLQWGITSSGPIMSNNNSSAKIRNQAGRNNIVFVDVTGGVNTPQVSNSPSGSGPSFGVSTSDTNCDVWLTPKGTGGAGLGLIRVFSGSGAPTISATAGDLYVRRDTPGTAGQQIYQCTGTTNWTPLSSAAVTSNFQASDVGMAGWNYDPGSASSNAFPASSGQLILARVKITSATVTNILYDTVVAGATGTSGQCFVGLYSASGTLLGQSADISGDIANTGLRTVALTSPATGLAPGSLGYVALLWNATTLPKLLANGNGTPYQATAGGTSNSRYLNAGSGVTALPGSVTIGSTSAANNSTWVGLS